MFCCIPIWQVNGHLWMGTEELTKHFHLGRKLRLRHFRDGVELPWLSTDDNYTFDFQQNRPLLEEVKVLPGDQLICGKNVFFLIFFCH